MHNCNSVAGRQEGVSIDRTHLSTTSDITYLDCSIEREVIKRISTAIAAFGQLMEKVYLNRNRKLSTKIMVHEAIVLFILLYCSET